MDRDQTKQILSAYRPGRDEGDPLFTEALAAAAQDPELTAWLAEQTAGDDTVRAAFRSITPPAHLREALLASAKTIQFPAPPQTRGLPIWLAAAAAIVLALGTTFYLSARPAGMPFTKLTAEIPRLTAAHEHPFATDTGNPAEIKTWLAAHGGPSQFTVPAGLRGTQAMGCEITSVGGTKVSIVCFETQGEPVHLYIVDRKHLAQPPPMNNPTTSQEGEYAMVSWSDGDHSYILAQRGTTQSLRRLL